jgi:hypothetical protein
VKVYTVFVFFILFSSTLFAQLEKQPIPIKSRASTKDITAQNLRTAVLSLPFFDDFSQSSSTPDPGRWAIGNGVLVSNQFAINPPSFNVATFNGVNGAGIAYNTLDSLAAGPADTLMSNEIDLSGYTPSSNIFLSFWYESGGLGEKPEAGDVMILQFKNASGVWKEKIRLAGEKLNAFKQSILPVDSSQYLHSAFQFRFINFSKLSGNFDTWHIDYIYLNNNRHSADTIFTDIAISRPPFSVSINGQDTFQTASVLKRYTSMPKNQFIVNPEAELADSVMVTINNLNNQFNFYNKTIYITPPNQTVTKNHFIAANKRQDSLGVKILPGWFTNDTSAYTLKYKFQLSYNFTSTRPEMVVPFQANDTITGSTVLHNYFAYDDGSAEYTIALNQKFGKVAYRYIMNTPDTLSDIEIHFPFSVKNVEGQNFNLMLWKKLRNGQDSFLLRRPVTLKYNGTGFTRYLMDSTVRFVLKDTFYIGWEQTADYPLRIGFDENTRSMNHVFVNLAGTWTPFDLFEGSIMMRPLFRSNIKTASEEDIYASQYKIYPNPGSGKVYLEGAAEKVYVYDLTGSLKSEITLVPGDLHEFDLSLKPGMYLLRIVNRNKFVTKKLIVQ